MDPELKNDRQEMFDQLPQDIKEVIFADDYQRILDGVAKKYNLSPTQKSKLEFETTMVLLGVNNRSYFPFNLETELNIDEDTAQSISSSITDTVFAEVWRSLDEMDEKEVGTDEELNAKIDYEEKKMESEPLVASEETEMPSIAAVSPLATLADRLKKASIATPVTKEKDNGVDRASKSSDAIDPYHESIDNE